jgi:2-iminoacetate synthase
MEFAIPGFIKRFCTPNALLTLKEYLEDYASPEVKARGAEVIAAEVAKLSRNGGQKIKDELLARLQAIENGQRDLYF